MYTEHTFLTQKNWVGFPYQDKKINTRIVFGLKRLELCFRILLSDLQALLVDV